MSKQDTTYAQIVQTQLGKSISPEESSRYKISPQRLISFEIHHLSPGSEIPDGFSKVDHWSIGRREFYTRGEISDIHLKSFLIRDSAKTLQPGQTVRYDLTRESLQ